jgi:hypothetical protein
MGVGSVYVPSKVRIVHEDAPEALLHHSAGWGDAPMMAEGALGRVGPTADLKERVKALQGIAPPLVRSVWHIIPK